MRLSRKVEKGKKDIGGREEDAMLTLSVVEFEVTAVTEIVVQQHGQPSESRPRSGSSASSARGSPVPNSRTRSREDSGFGQQALSEDERQSGCLTPGEFFKEWNGPLERKR